MAHEDLVLLQAILRSSLDARAQVLQVDGRNGIFWVHRDCRRWGEDFVAPLAEQRAPVGFWRFGEGVEMLELVCGGLRRELASWVIFGQKMVQLFTVVG